ncbi:single-stranded DNA-binding protein [Vibrio sp.]|uniref:single-stranded DNA-binding protein n=1 Tax=Vibrio sp. TaxID=678 RepID=UPI003D107236
MYRNRVELIGNLGSDPEIVELNNNGIACNITVATTKRYKKEGETVSDTEWHDVAIYGPTAQYVADYAKKGMEVNVVGSLRTRTFETDEGTRRLKEIYVSERQHEVQLNFHSLKDSDSESEAKPQTRQKVARGKPAAKRQKSNPSDAKPDKKLRVEQQTESASEAPREPTQPSKYAPPPENWNQAAPF